MQLSLTLPPHMYAMESCSLHDCFAHFMAPDSHMMECLPCQLRRRQLHAKFLEETEPYYCPSERLENMDRAPVILSLHIQRLVQGRFTAGRLVHLHQHVDFPLTLSLADIFASQHGPTSPKTPQLRAIRSALIQQGITYRLMAVIVHHPSGNVNGGHYTTYRRLLSRNPVSQEEYLQQLREKSFHVSDHWVHVSDEKIKYVSEEEVLLAPAYMLFYQKDDEFL